MPPHSMMPRNSDEVKGVQLQEGTLRRVWGFAKPYRGTIALFLAAIFAAALLALVAPFVARGIIDTAIPDSNRGLIVFLASIAVAAALADAVLAIVLR